MRSYITMSLSYISLLCVQHLPGSAPLPSAHLLLLPAPREPPDREKQQKEGPLIELSLFTPSLAETKLDLRTLRRKKRRIRRSHGPRLMRVGCSLGTCQDPSLTYRPEPENHQYRNYKDCPLLDRVKNTYTLMHTYQTVQFVKEKHAQWGSCTHRKMSVMEAINLLDNLVDESDPDVDFPNSFHAYQTAEGIRRIHPDKDWFQLVGLLHDIGKMMALDNEPQDTQSLQDAADTAVFFQTLFNILILWSVVGDTFPVGCKFQQSIVFSDTTFQDNPDTKHPIYSTKYGIYKPNCGLENVLMSWGHDEYLYKVLTFNKCSIPEEGLYMIRFHSFYPWHTGGDYQHLCNDKDHRMLHWVKEFNKFDLYTKTEDLPDVELLRPYYQELIDKYCPGVLSW